MYHDSWAKDNYTQYHAHELTQDILYHTRELVVLCH